MFESLSSSTRNVVAVLKVAIPVAVGLASAVYLGKKMAAQSGSSDFSRDKTIPTVAIRAGDQSHDAEYNEDPDKFLQKCEKQYGQVFNLLILNQRVTCVSGPTLVRDIFMTDDLNFSDALNQLTGLHAFMASIRKSNKDADNRMPHELIKDAISPNMAEFTPRIVSCAERVISGAMGGSNEVVIDHLGYVIQEIIASAMADVYMGSELEKDRKVIDAFIMCNYDFGMMLAFNSGRSFWHSIKNKFKYNVRSPLHKHVQALVDVATPVLERRSQLKAEALRQGKEYSPPTDVLQAMVDNAAKYGYVDLEDICGHILILVLASVHTTNLFTTHALYYMAAYPQYIEPMFEEVQEVLNEQAKEREEQRQEQLASGNVSSMAAFLGTELDPQNDRQLSEKAVRKLQKIDSFVRETMRYQNTRLFGTHLARRDTVLSNGMKITKGSRVIGNVTSVHFSEELQGEEPFEFRPWRFVGKGKGASKAAVDLLPFGIGRHACPGRFLAVNEIKIVCALIVTKFSKLEIKEKEKTMDMLLDRLGYVNPPSPIIMTRREGSILQSPAPVAI
ncbi:hypothetical protein BGZ70_006216 [Mortierella alpina]|uniref:Cytochrome P450 n=1 Tax=Mortierella alpina TaxID=64518 RepID=A0A9P6J8D8_MORAP|nr:hypothetical protein BGZ70_006216 [Mortierella alpina]